MEGRQNDVHMMILPDLGGGGLPCPARCILHGILTIMNIERVVSHIRIMGFVVATRQPHLDISIWEEQRGAPQACGADETTVTDAKIKTCSEENRLRQSYGCYQPRFLTHGLRHSGTSSRSSSTLVHDSS